MRSKTLLNWQPPLGNSNFQPTLVSGPALALGTTAGFARTYTDIVDPGDACGPIDISSPFGLIDLDDLDCFILQFLGGDQGADLVPPFGIVDLDDVNAFISLFLAGCP